MSDKKQRAVKPKDAGKLHGRIHIGRLMGSGPDVMRLEISCETSGVSFLVVEMAPGDLMCAITGKSMKCQMEVRGLNLVGTTVEHKTEDVEFNYWGVGSAADRKGKDDHERSPSVDRVLAPYETDGWRGSCSDLFNHHRRTDGAKGYQRVTFHRYIDANGNPVLNP